MKIENVNETSDTTNVSSGYVDNYQYLMDLLGLLDLRLLKAVVIFQKKGREDTEGVRGLFISPEEVMSLLGPGGADYSGDPDIEVLNDRIRETASNIDLKLSNSEDIVTYFPLSRLARTFGLVMYELQVLILALAPEIDRKYEKIYAFLNDDMSRKLPTISLAIDVLSNKTSDNMSAWRFFSPQSPLIYFKLIHYVDDHNTNVSSNCRFRLDERIKRYFSGDNGFPASIVHIAKAVYPVQAGAGGNIQDDVKDKIIKLITSGSNGDLCRPVFWFYGNENERKKATVIEVCNKVKIPLLIADLSEILLEQDLTSVMMDLFRESALQSALLYFSGGECLTAEHEKSEVLRKTLLRAISEISWITFISADSIWMPQDDDGKFLWHPIEFRPPGFKDRKEVWSRELKGGGLTGRDIDIISGRFNFSEGQIKRVVRHACSLSNGDGLSIESIYSACGLQSSRRLGIYARQVKNHYTWDDIVLSDDSLKHLKEISRFINNQYRVYYNWGFEEKLALGKGLNALFSGPSGTGKTMAADVIASELQLELYKIDLSSIVSKYIGETEKNLNKIFNEASSGNVILFFDEADALFGKRSEVKDAHDRYANIEINYLLQKVEEHEGAIILATNLSKNIDEAFLRRMQFTIEFPFPEVEQREGIWKKIFPTSAPVSKDLDFGFLSDRLKLPGGNIKNIALTAAFYAAEGDDEINMRYIIMAAKREYLKMGKSFVMADFEPYSDFMAGEGV